MRRERDLRFQGDIIAVWWRKHDGMELCYLRHGTLRFRHGPEGDLLPGEQKIDFSDAAIYAYEHGFQRRQRVY